MSETLTKFQILKTYRLAGHPEYIRDTWQNLGGAVITPESRTFIKDMIYRVDAPDVVTPPPPPAPVVKIR